MRSWGTPIVFAGLLVLAVVTSAVELPTGPNVPSNAAITLTGASLEGMAGTTEAASPSRVLPTPAIMSTRARVKISSHKAVPQDVPAGTPYAGEYIVLFRESVADIEAVTERARMAAIQLTAQAMEEGELALAVGADAASAVAVLSATPAPEGVSSQALIRVPHELKPNRVKGAIMTNPEVKAVVANRVVRISQAITADQCTPAYFASAAEARPKAGFHWAGCSGEGVRLAAFGERCGSAHDKFMWTGLFAYNKATGQMLPNCVAFAAAEADPARKAELFGSCGVAPTQLMGLPTSACSENDSAMPMSDACVEVGSLPSYSIELSSGLCPARGSHSVTFKGTPCGPGNSLVQWQAMSAPACGTTLARESLDPKQQADWVGQCGVPPMQISGLPTKICAPAELQQLSRRARRSRHTVAPPLQPWVTREAEKPVEPVPSTQSLGRATLAKGESTTNWGMTRIGARGTDGKVIDASAAIASTGYKVLVMDTGVEKTHPDLNVVEFVDFVDAEGTADHGIDGHGHGTHVGGIIGAKNQGSGVTGVVPGMPLIAFKVLGRDGSGPLDGIYKGYTEILARQGKGEKIVAINLSLGSPVMDEDSLKVECDWVKKLAAYGTTIVAAAGNDGGELLTGTMPAACPDALSVTSITSDDSPSYFSNLAQNDSADYIKTKTVAAPGSSIYSTFNNGGYMTLSGTSMATPHTSGAVAACFLAGECKLGASSTTGVIPKIQGAAKGTTCANAKKCGPNWGSESYYGYAITVRNW